MLVMVSLFNVHPDVTSARAVFPQKQPLKHSLLVEAVLEKQVGAKRVNSTDRTKKRKLVIYHVCKVNP